MATFYEILIGCQLIDKINIGNDMIYQTSCHFKRLSPYSLEPLQFFEGAIASPSVARTATVEDIKTLVNVNCEIVTTEVDTRLALFLNMYPDTQEIINALQYYNTKYADLEYDLGEIQIHKPNILNVLSLVSTYEGLLNNGNLLGLYSPKIELEINADIALTLDMKRRVSYQDLINCIAFHLKGLCSSTGNVKYKSIESRKEAVNARLETILLQRPLCSSNSDIFDMDVIVTYIQAELPKCNNEKACETLGLYIDTQIPQLPVVRRWWNYGA